MAKIDIRVVAYRGGGPALNDLLGGHIPLSINNMPEAIGQVASGTVRALGVTTATRSPFLPDVPTFAEAGVPGYDSTVW
ncbi:tripartite tricarboxylate transporter substrate-binding protein, partial [Acinetobacter baumannii]